MINQPGKKDASFKTRQVLSASELTRLVEMSLKRITTGPGLTHRTINNQLVISTKGTGKGKKGKGGGDTICGPGDCPDSCEDIIGIPADVVWFQGTNNGCFRIFLDCTSVCFKFLDPSQVSICIGSVTDPATGRVWTLDAIWDVCAPTQLTFNLSDCSGGTVFIDPAFGATILTFPGCPTLKAIDVNVDINAQSCVGANTFPCCATAEGCSCG